MTERQLQEAVRRYATAREKRDEAFVRASVEGMSLRQIARVADLSPTRIAQIVKQGRHSDEK